MAFQAVVLRVMVASPSDVQDSRATIESALYEWNTISAGNRGVLLLPWLFESAAVPIAGAHPQAIINSQGLKDADIVFAVFGSRIGSPTQDAISGTVEEIEGAIKAGKPVHIYFSSGPVPNDVDTSQLTALRAFKDELQTRALLGQFADAGALASEVRKAIELDLTTLDLTSIAPAAAAGLQPLLVQPKAEREMKQDSKGKLSYTTRHWIEITNPNTDDATEVSIAPDGSQDFWVASEGSTVIHGHQTRTFSLAYSMATGSDPVVVVSWSIGEERFTKKFHIG